jgi:hypothetical protein
MNDTQINALREFARLHGKQWKTALNDLWISGKDSGALRQIRNNFKPFVMSDNFYLGE